MRPADWIVLGLTLLSIVLYGLYKGRGSKDIRGYLLADRQMRWYTVALSIMATQASAITFTSTPGQAFVDGMRFVQFYLGLPIAMVILSVTAVPIFHRLNVFTAYEYLEHRFDTKTRSLLSLIFLTSRGLAAGMTIYAPSLVLSVMLGFDITVTSTVIGGLIILYTTMGGVKAVNWTDFQQMLIIMSGMVLAFIMTIVLLPRGVTFTDALHVAGSLGKLNVIDFSFDLSNRYNFWSGLIGGTFVALAYFGTDQSQVQRYLTGKSIAQSRLGLLFNAMAKVPMQFFILLIGVMVFVFYQFQAPPLFFNPVETQRVKASQFGEEYSRLEGEYREHVANQSAIVHRFLDVRENGSEAELERTKTELLAAQEESGRFRRSAGELIGANDGNTNDTNYLFLAFVMQYLPIGVVGLIFACIFAASMSSTSGELSALATTSVVDIYKRHVRADETPDHYLRVSRIAMASWGVYGILFAQYASGLGSLVEAVNILGSLFYGTMLGVFLLAFYVKFVTGTPVFVGALVSEALVISLFLCEQAGLVSVAWLWYPVIGCSVVVLTALVLQMLHKKSRLNHA